MGIGLLLGINAAGVDITTLNVLTGAIGLAVGFGLQAIAANFVSGYESMRVAFTPTAPVGAG